MLERYWQMQRANLRMQCYGMVWPDNKDKMEEAREGRVLCRVQRYLRMPE